MVLNDTVTASVPLGAGALMLTVAAAMAWRLGGYDPGSATMREVSGIIASGSDAFLRKEYGALACFYLLAKAWLFG